MSATQEVGVGREAADGRRGLCQSIVPGRPCRSALDPLSLRDPWARACTRLHTHVHACTRLHTYTCPCLRTNAHVHTHTHACTYLHMDAHTCTYTPVHTYACTHTHVHAPAHIHTCTRKHMHTCTRLCTCTCLHTPALPGLSRNTKQASVRAPAPPPNGTATDRTPKVQVKPVKVPGAPNFPNLLE